MNTPEVSEGEQELAFSAWQRGEPVQFWHYATREWCDLKEGASIIRTIAIRRKPSKTQAVEAMGGSAWSVVPI